MESGAPFFTPGQTVPAELIQSEEAGGPAAVGQVIDPADIVSQEPARHPLLSRTPKDLADDDTFDPVGYAKTYFDDLGNDRELLTHLAEVDRLRGLKPMNPVKVAVGAAKGFGQMIADAPRMAQNVAGTALKATPGVAEAVTLAATGELDTDVASAMRTEAKTEFAASVESQSQQTASGLVGAVDRFVVQPAARGIALSAAVADAAAEKAGVGPGQLRSFVRAVGQAARANDPLLMSADQNADSFLQKVALAQTIDESSRGEGPVLQAAGFDMAALAQEGIVVDPQVVEDLGLLTDVTEYIPALKGFKAVARGKTLLSAPTKAAAMRGVQKLRQAGASAARRAADVAGAAGKIQPTTAAIAGAVVDGGAGAAAAATVPRVARLAEKGLQAGAEMIEGSRAIPGAGVMGAVAGSAPVRGALRGLAAPFSPELDNVIPMVAAAGQGSDEQIGQAIGSTAAFGAMGGAAGGAAKGGADYVVKKRFEQIQREPVADIEYGTDPALDAAHRAQMAAIRTADPAAANSLNWIRATALPAGSELYVLPNDVFSRQVSTALGQPEGTQFDTPGFIETRPDGSTRVYLNENTTALGHEAGHALVAAMDPNSRRVLFSSIKSAYGPEQIQRFGQVYDALLGAQQGAEGQGMRGDETRIINELAAEMLTSALYSEPLDAAPPGLYRQIIGGLAQLAEATTLYQPQVSASGPLASALGVTPSVQASDFAMNFLRNAQNDPNWMAGPRPPVLPDPTPATPTPAAPAAGGMSRREFLSGGISARRRNAQAGTPPAAPAAPAAPTAAPQPLAAPQPAPARRQVSLEDIENAVEQPVQPPGSVPPVIPPAVPPVIPPAVPPVIPEAPAPAAPPAPPVIPPRTSAERLAQLRQQAAQPPARPQNMRVTPEEQATLDTQRQVTGAVDAERAIAANPGQYDETAQRAFADINAALQRPQGQVAPVRLAYRSVTPTQGGASNARARKAEQDAAYEREAQLALQGLPSDVRTLFDKVTIPYRWTSENGNVNVFAMSFDKVLANLRTVTRRAEAAGARNLVPYATTAQGNLTPDAARQFAADLRTYTANQANGYSGAGAEVTVPPGYRGQIPERNASYRPVAIDQNRADFINLLMGISPPATARVTADARQRGSVPNVEAGRLAAANQRPVVQAATANPDRNTYGANPAVGITTPTPIVEPNPLRNEFARRGVDLTGRNLFQVTENLNLQDIQSVTPAPESGFRAPSKDLIQAGFMPKLADDRTSGKAFKNFFSAVTSGESKYRPNSPWKNLLPLDEQEGFLREYDQHTGNFDAHIGTSIPGYKDVQVRVGNAVATVYSQGGRVLDIGASEGSWAKTISALTEGRVQTVALDPNPAMARFFQTKSQVPGATYDTRAFREGFEDEGVVIQPFDSEQPFDVIHEAMVFQFISPERDAQLDEVKRLLRPEGVLFAEEKFKTSPEEWAANEDKKDREFKDLFYSRDPLAAKQAVVKFQQDPAETKAVGMVDNMVSPETFESQLAARFKHVVQYWDSGNFKGYAASDSREALDRMVQAIGDTTTDFTVRSTPREVTGLSFMPAPPEGSEAFNRWIAGSYFVNPDGTPMRLYHGTDVGGFTVFDGRRRGLDYDEDENVAFFTPDRRVAQTYVEGTPDRPDEGVELGRVSARVAAGVPLTVLERYDENYTPYDQSGVYEVFISIPPEQVWELDWQGNSWREAPNTKEMRGVSRIEEVGMYARSYGYRAAVVRNVHDRGNGAARAGVGRVPSTTVIVVDPGEDGVIKSADQNRGTYDRSNPDISFMPTAAEYEARRALDRAAAAKTKARPKVTARDAERPKPGEAQLVGERLPASYDKKPEVRAVRYSSRAGSPTASPQNFGKGVATSTDRRGLPKVYFYEEGSPTGSDKDVVATAGKTKYGARLSTARLYDAMGEDPLNYLGTVNREKADQQLIDAGYAGLRIVSGDGRKIIALFEPVAQTELGRATRNEGRATVPKNAPSFMPKPVSDEVAKAALSSEKQPKFGAARDTAPGTKVGLRVDIPAFLRTGNYVVSVHEAASGGRVGKIIGYDSKARVTDPTFFVNEAVAERIRDGQSKSPIATVEGAYAADQDIPDVSDWLPVGMNPKKHSYFYDKESDRPVVSGSEAALVGNTVYVKDPVFGEASDFRFMPYAGPQSDLDARQQDAYSAAQAMDAAGRDQEDIRAATGWFRGRYDDKWRYEVRDDRASLKIDSVQSGPTSLTLGEILDHPDLFKAYPEAKRIRAYFSDRLPDGASAVYNPRTGAITLDSTRIPDRLVERVIPLLLHEVQHWIQDREGFARGSDLQEFDSEDLQLSPEDAAKDQALVDEQDRIEDEITSLREAMAKIPESEKGVGKPIASTGRRLDGLQDRLSDLRKQSRDIRRPYVRARAEEAYRNSAGEIEARDVELRRRMSPERRAELPPYTSENIPKERAGVNFMPRPESTSDEEYLAAVARGDLTTAQKLVDEAAKKAGYNYGPLFHSRLQPFKAFEKYGKFMGASGVSGIHLTDSYEMAKRYLDRYADRGWVDGKPYQEFKKEVIRLYAKIQKPLIRQDPFPTKLGLGAPLPAGYVSPVEQMGYDALIRDEAISKGGSVKHTSAKNAIKGKEIIVFNPSAVKSADPVTYDDAGAVVPLSRRFGEGSDLRFMPRPESPERKTRADIDRGALPPGQARDLDSWVSTRIPWAKGNEDDGYNNDLIVGTEDVFGYTPAAQSKLNESIKDIPGMGDLKGRFGDVVYQFRDRLVDNLLLLHDAMPGDFRNRARLWYDGARVLAEGFAQKYGVRTDQAAAVLATLSPQMDWYVNVHLADMTLEAVTQHQNTKLPETAADWVRQKITLIPAEAERSIRKAWPEERKAEKRANAVKAVDKLQRAFAKIEGRTLAETEPAFQPFWVRAYWEREGTRRTPTVTPEGSVLPNVPAGSTRWQNYGAIAKAILAVNAPDRRRISELVGEMHKVRNFYNNILLPSLDLGDITVDTHAIAAALMLPYPSSAPAVSVGLGSGGQDASSGSQGLYGVYADAYRIAAARRGLQARQMQSITWEALRGVYLPKSRAKGSPIRQGIEKAFRERAKSGGSVADSVTAAIQTAGGFRLPAWFTGVTGYLSLPDWQAGRLNAAVVDNEEEGDADE